MSAALFLCRLAYDDSGCQCRPHGRKCHRIEIGKICDTAVESLFLYRQTKRHDVQ